MDTTVSGVLATSRGVVIYVKDYIPAEIRNDFTNSDFKESVWVDVSINKSDKILIGGIYRSPNSTNENTLSKLNLLMRRVKSSVNIKSYLAILTFLK